MTQAEAYIAGWRACFNGEDGRYTNPCERRSDARFAWDHGFLNAMEAEDGEEPDPASVDYH